MYGLKRVRTRRHDALARLRWDQLESLLATYYRRAGFSVEVVGAGGTGARYDVGIDLKLYKGDQFLIVQCRHWKVRPVPPNAVHDLIGMMLTAGATGAIFVSSGEFNRYARESAARYQGVQLVDGGMLRAMVGPEAAALPPPTTAPPPTHTPADMPWPPVDRRWTHDSPMYRMSRSAALSNGLGGVLALVAVSLGFVAVVLWATAPPAPTPRPVVAAAAAPVPAPTRVATQSGAVTSAPAARSPAIRSTVPATRPAPPPPTEEEIRESQRKAEEAMRVLEASTPEA
jgi:hypothetical protein